jgi:predicted ATPase
MERARYKCSISISTYEKSPAKQAEMTLYDTDSNKKNTYQRVELLLEKYSETEIRSNIFIIVNLLGKNRGSLPDEGLKEKIQMARLCLKADDNAIQISCFSPAANYLDNGIDLLGAKDYAEKPLALLKEHNCRQSESQTHFLVYLFVMHWVSPREKLISGHLDGYYTGIATGDT